MITILKTATCISVLLFSQWSYGQWETRVNKNEDCLTLPDYCKANGHTGCQDPNQESLKVKWWGILGKDMMHIHHYCWGLYNVHRAHGITDKPNREEILKGAIGDMQYVLSNASPEFKLLPKICYDIGQIREELGDSAGAMKEYYQSIKLNPKLPIPYAAISDLLQKQNKPKEAIAILEQGLKYKPKSKTLLKRMALLTKEK